MKDTGYSDVVIVGGGASGLAAAVELRMSSPDLGVTVLEKNPEPARKIRATGSGRCNITNRDAEGYAEIMKFFARIGLVTRTYDNGLVYPYSESAADVADLLTARAEELGVDIITDAEVTAAGTAAADDADFAKAPRKGEMRFEITYDHSHADSVRDAGGRRGSGAAGSRKKACIIRSAFLILACGGKAGPMFGTTGDGYKLARELGHSIVTPVPVLTSMECKEWENGAEPAGITLAGTRTRGTVALYRQACAGEPAKLFEETGEIQFTRYGLSGICIFNMTRHMRYDRSAGESLGIFTVSADLFPDGSISAYLSERRDNAFGGEKVSGVLRTVLKENIAAYVLGRAEKERGSKSYADLEVADLTDEDISAISRAVHSLTFCPEKIRGWKEAQATSGGVSLEELDPDSGRSLIVPGLFVTGELADRDFMCGGFNLSNAWLTGLKAAQEIAARHVQLQDK